MSKSPARDSQLVFHPIGIVRPVTPAEAAALDDASARYNQKTRGGAVTARAREAYMANFGLHTAYPLPERAEAARRRAKARDAARWWARIQLAFRRLTGHTARV
jgi:hypothetical protein